MKCFVERIMVRENLYESWIQGTPDLDLVLQKPFASAFGRWVIKTIIPHTIEYNRSGPICIVTHNGVLRCLLGDAFSLDLNEWYKLVIPHGIPLEFLYWRNRFYPNIPRTSWFEIFQNIGYAVL